MRQRFYILLLSLVCSSVLLFGQQPVNKWCGYTGISPWLDWYQRNSGLFGQEGSDTTWLYVPVTVHLVGNNDETGFYPFDEAARAICEMNEQFAPAYIRFYLKPGDAVQYHPNSSWNNHDWSGGSDMITTVTQGIENRLNAFVVSDPAGNCGYSWMDAIVLKKGCSSSGNSTWAHEAGHHLSLPHPFVGWENFSWDYAEPAPAMIDNHPVEKTDRANCYTAGDRFCDTDPDYLNFRWTCNSTSRSGMLQHDPDNVPFRSDGTLYMSYADDACATRFSTEQIAAMRANLRTEHSQYLQINSPLTGLGDQDVVELISPIDTSDVVQFNHIELKWKAVPNAKFYSIEVSHLPSFNSKLYRQTVTNATELTINKALPNGRTLYWRVRAFNEWDVCPASAPGQYGSFRTQNLSATNDLERAAIIEMSPNPVSAGVSSYLNIQSDEAMAISIRICDGAGRLCYQQVHRLYSGENRIELPTANLGAGAYAVFIQNEKGAIIKRLAVVL